MSPVSTSHRMKDPSVPVLSATYDDLCDCPFFANHRGRLPAPDRDTKVE
ncbi:hypothetical protein ACIOHS_19280 [Streptomyces sp. NPDC088253]